MSNASDVKRYVRIKGLIAALEAELDIVKGRLIETGLTEVYGDDMMLKINREASRKTYSEKNLLTKFSQSDLDTVVTKTVYTQVTVRPLVTFAKAA
jgi:hypothetical protein